MGLSSHPVGTTAFGADLLLAHHVLAALESGRMPMHADEFRAISQWALNAFESLDAVTLRDLAQNLRGPLKEIAQNVLYFHGDAEWATNPWDNRIAENACARLLGAMRAR
jgi:hypothetical protein